MLVPPRSPFHSPLTFGLSLLLLLTGACGTPATTDGVNTEADALESSDGGDATSALDIDFADLDLKDIDINGIDPKDIQIDGLDISLDGIDIAFDLNTGTDVAADAGADADAVASEDGGMGPDMGADVSGPGDADVAAQTDATDAQSAEDAADTGTWPDTATGDDAPVEDAAVDADLATDASTTDALAVDDAADTGNSPDTEDATEDAGVDAALDVFSGCTSTEACDDGNLCTTDACELSGDCTSVNNTAACSDGNACTVADACLAGACLPGDPTVCNDDNPCTTDSCNPNTGACDLVPNQAPCNDGVTCTYADICAGSTCAGTWGDTGCADGNDCTLDSCDQLTDACVNLAQDTTCSDGDVCTGGDTCVEGVCMTPEFGEATIDQASYQTGGSTNVNPNNPSSLGTAFGQSFVAGQSGALQSIEVALNMVQPTSYGYQATVASGSATITVYANDGTALGSASVDLATLSDGSASMEANAVHGTVFGFAGVYLTAGTTYRFRVEVKTTYKPKCQSGGNAQYCQGTFVNAFYYQECTTSADCVWPIYLGSSGSAAAYSDGAMYSESIDFPGPSYKQDDLQFKTVMKPAFNQALNGTTCSDGLACTSADACVLGKCVATMDCNDEIACTVDACTPAGCTYTPDTKTCDDGDTCTLETCDLAVGCTSTGAATDGTDCSDGNACVVSASCASGKCQETLLTCPDANFCTIGYCDKQSQVCELKARACPDESPCLKGYCDAPNSICTVLPPYPNQPCDDGSACTEYSFCDSNKNCIADTVGICVAGAACTKNIECTTNNCANGKCFEFTCPNGEMDAGEFGVDCGGVCPIGCGQGNYCVADKDCLAPLWCKESFCAP